MEKEVLKKFGFLDVLPYYSAIAPYLKKFLKGKEIATKVWLPGFFFLKRGSKLKPLYINYLSAVNEKMFRLREKDLKTAKPRLNEKQVLIWDYFVPRKLADFFYATNNETPGKDIERIFFDIDRGSEIQSEKAQEVAKLLVQEIKQDKQFNKLFKFKIFIMWTGSSFHIYLLLKKSIKNSEYNKYLAYSKDSPLKSFTGKFAYNIQKKVKFKVQGGHEKINGISIDPSQTPSGKLARAPFSLHMKSAKEVDGVAVPVTEKDLNSNALVKSLKSLTPDDVLKKIKTYSKLLL